MIMGQAIANAGASMGRGLEGYAGIKQRENERAADLLERKTVRQDEREDREAETVAKQAKSKENKLFRGAKLIASAPDRPTYDMFVAVLRRLKYPEEYPEWWKTVENPDIEFGVTSDQKIDESLEWCDSGIKAGGITKDNFRDKADNRIRGNARNLSEAVAMDKAFSDRMTEAFSDLSYSPSQKTIEGGWWGKDTTEEIPSILRNPEQAAKYWGKFFGGGKAKSPEQQQPSTGNLPPEDKLVPDTVEPFGSGLGTGTLPPEDKLVPDTVEPFGSGLGAKAAGGRRVGPFASAQGLTAHAGTMSPEQLAVEKARAAGINSVEDMAAGPATKWLDDLGPMARGMVGSDSGGGKAPSAIQKSMAGPTVIQRPDADKDTRTKEIESAAVLMNTLYNPIFKEIHKAIKDKRASGETWSAILDQVRRIMPGVYEQLVAMSKKRTEQTPGPE